MKKQPVAKSSARSELSEIKDFVLAQVAERLHTTPAQVIEHNRDFELIMRLAEAAARREALRRIGARLSLALLSSEELCSEIKATRDELR